MLELEEYNNKLTDSDVVSLVKVQVDNCCKLHDFAYSLLTPKEKEFLEPLFNSSNKVFLSNVVQTDTGKYISLFVPEFQVKECYVKSKHFKYEITYLKQDHDLKIKVYDFLPRVVEYPSYENHNVEDYIGCHNGYGWEIVRARLVEKVHWSREILY